MKQILIQLEEGESYAIMVSWIHYNLSGRQKQLIVGLKIQTFIFAKMSIICTS
jgi:hypothetical protein